MPRSAPFAHTSHGHFVGYSLLKRGADPCWYVRFRSKDGRRLERDTRTVRINTAHDAARAIIDKEYEPAPTDPELVSWEETIDRLKKAWAGSGNRPATLGYYLKLIRLLRDVMYRTSAGPAEVSPRGAQLWRDEMMAPRKNGKQRSPHYVGGLLIGMSSLWQTWFMDELKIVAGNPWQGLEPPKADKLPVRYATDEQLEHFNAWLTERFGDWSFPRLFLLTKAHTACRLMDLCRLKSAQLRGGRLVFPADVTKGRKERSLPLPADLYASLDLVKGPTWLWEGYPAGLRTAIAAKGWPVHQLKADFDPTRLYNWVETLFTEYREAFPDRPRLTTHMLRKRAFTRAWNAGIDPRKAAIAYSCNIDTVMKHYVALDEQQVTDEVFDQMGGT